MDSITALLGFLAALSIATERITGTIKGLPGLSQWLTKDEKPGSTREELRKAVIQVIAIGVGTLLAWLIKEQLPATLPLKITSFPTALVFGAMSSGGSAIWNSALDITREINKQKQLLTSQMAGGTIPPPGQAKAIGAGQ